MLETIRDIVAIDSNAATPDGVRAVIETIGGSLASVGFRLTRHPVTGYADCLEATLECGEGPAVVVLGHADTVWPEGTCNTWSLAHRDGWLDGPGVGDMKAALVMAAHVLRAVIEDPQIGWGTITMLITSEEQLGSVGARPLLERFASSTDLCLTLEAVQPSGGVIVSRGAVGAVTLSAHGRTAHCTEQGGASVISELAEVLPRVEVLNRPDDGLLVSIGTVHAGSARQVVPDTGVVDIDIRGTTVDVAESGVQALRAIVDGPRTVDGVRLDLSGGVTRPAFTADRSWPVYEIAATAASALGLPSRPEHVRGGSDASFFGAQDVMTLDGLGPYCENSCSRRERVAVSSIPERAAILADILVRAPRACRARAL